MVSFARRPVQLQTQIKLVEAIETKLRRGWCLRHALVARIAAAARTTFASRSFEFAM